MKGEKVVMVVPRCSRCGRISGRVDYYDLAVTNKRVVGARIGRSYLSRKVTLGSLAGGLPEGRQLDEILELDRNNFALPFSEFARIAVTKALGEPYIQFKLKDGVDRRARHASVPRELAFDTPYFGGLQSALRDLAGDIAST